MEVKIGERLTGCEHVPDPDTFEYDKTFGRSVKCKKCGARLVPTPRPPEPRKRPKMSKKERRRLRAVKERINAKGETS